MSSTLGYELSEWSPPNRGYTLDANGYYPLESSYDLSKSNPDGGPLGACPIDGGTIIRIGSSGAYDARCQQCGAQYLFRNLRGIAIVPRDGLAIPNHPPDGINHSPVSSNYQQPNAGNPTSNADVASYPVAPLRPPQ